MAVAVPRCPKCGSESISYNPRLNRYYCWDCSREFEPPEGPDDGRAETPLRIFLSYGHPEEEIVRRIKGRLEERGHEVWFDKAGHGEADGALGIELGDDWRESIAKGVRSSNGVIAFLSKHAVRPGGVCLHEIDIAIAVRGGNIKTVLLDPEREARPPAEVGHVQWLDMSSWRDRLAEGEGSFGPWFEERMRELVRVVESRESVQFSGDITAISERLGSNLALDTSKQAYLLSRPFVGREWLMERIAQWLDDRSAPRVCLVTGDVGVGKSAFAAHLAHWSWRLCGRVAASFFCEAGRERYNDPSAIVQTLAYLLACRLPQYRVLLRATLDRAPDLGAMGADDLFTLLVGEPLSHHIDAGHECMLVVVDGIDEAGGAGSNRLARTFARYAERLPAWMKVLVTSRRVSEATTPFGTGALHLDMSGDDGANMADMRDYLTLTLSETFKGEPGFDDAIASLAEASGGVFLYATLMADAALKGNVGLEDLARACPVGLHEKVLQWFEWTFPDVGEYRTGYRDALGCTAAAPGGSLPLAEFPVLFGWGENQTNDFLRRVEVFIRRVTDPLDGPSVALSHAFLAEWLAGEHAGVYQSTSGDATKLMARRYHEIASQDVALLSDYEVEHLFLLLEASGLSEELGKLLEDERVAWQVMGIAHKLACGGLLSRAYDLLERLKAIDKARNILSKHLKASLLNGLGNLLTDTGRHAEAETCYREALDISRGLADSDPTKSNVVAASLYNLGNHLQNSGRTAEAEAAHKEALEIRRKLAASDPAMLSEVAGSLNNLGILLHNSGRFTEAEDAHKEALEIRRKLAASDPSMLREAAQSLHNLGFVLFDSGRSAKAEAALKEALEIRRILAASDPAMLRDVSESLFGLGIIMRRANRFAEAEDAHKKALEIRRKLAASNPAMLSEVASSLNSLGTLMGRIGRTAEAEAYFREELKISRKLAASDSAMLSYVADSLNNLGFLLDATSRPAEAEKAYREAIDIRCKHASYNPTQHRHAADSLYNLGSLMERSGRYDEAEEAYQKALSIIRGLAASDPAMLDLEAQLFYSLGSLMELSGKYEEAMDAHKEALDIRRGLAASDPAMLDVVAESLCGLGAVLLSVERYGETERAFLEVVSIFRSLAESEPRKYTHVLADALENYGVIAQILSNEKTSTEALRISDELKREGTDVKALMVDTDCLLTELSN